MLARKETLKTNDVGTAGSATTQDGLLVSDFLDAIRAQFIGSGPKPAYPKGPKDKASAKVIREFPEALAAMMKAFEDGDDFPADAKEDSALALVIAAAAQAKWPNGGASIPAEWAMSPSGDDLTSTFRRYEIVSALKIMMRAYNQVGTGGGGTNFPPEKPA